MLILGSLSIYGNYYTIFYFTSLSNDKILDWSELKTFAEDKIRLTKMMIFVFDRVGSSVERGKNAAFSPFQAMFSKGFLTQGH